jgi:glycosyltransferase involved in cell wall biosynthesis
LKILQIIQTLNIGGAENFTIQLSNELSLSHEVSVIATSDSHERLNFVGRLNKNIQLTQLHWKKKYSVQQFLNLKNKVKEINPDVIHVHLHNSFYYVYVLSFFLDKKIYIHTIHSNINVWKKILKWVNFIQVLNNRIVHVCISKSIASEFKKKYTTLKSAQINNGIYSYIIKRSRQDINDFWKTVCGETTPAKCIRLLAIGNVSHYKNYILLAKAIKKIEASHPHVKCAIIGNTNNDTLAKEINDLGCKNLVLVGPKENGADFLIDADALVISSSEEGMPIVALEAMSLGKAILATPAGGMVDLVGNGHNGLLSVNFYEENFIDILMKFINLKQDEKKEIERNAKNSFEKRYKISVIANEYLKVYSS